MTVQPSISDKNTMLNDSPTRAEYLKLIFYHERKTYNYKNQLPIESTNNLSHKKEKAES